MCSWKKRTKIGSITSRIMRRFRLCKLIQSFCVSVIFQLVTNRALQSTQNVFACCRPCQQNFYVNGSVRPQYHFSSIPTCCQLCSSQKVLLVLYRPRFDP